MITTPCINRTPLTVSIPGPLKDKIVPLELYNTHCYNEDGILVERETKLNFRLIRNEVVIYEPIKDKEEEV